MTNPTDFRDLSPEKIITSSEKHLGIPLNGTVTPYNSYVNRVYGLQDDEDRRYAVKYYRPGRWTTGAIEEEHRFLFQCKESEVPVVPPLLSPEGKSLGSIDGISFAVFPFRGGRNFDITSDDDWIRLGSLIGRLHLAGQRETAQLRPLCSPSETTEKQIDTLTGRKLVHPDCLEDFENICREILKLIIPHFRDIESIRIHGDCHRGNILDRGKEGLLLIDFDDMMTGPPVQDLWLLLPGHHDECRTELELLLEGYTRFRKFDESTLKLIEPLRFMRMIHFLSWCAVQKGEPHFEKLLPDWGTEAFWIKELEDIRYQSDRIREVLV